MTWPFYPWGKSPSTHWTGGCTTSKPVWMFWSRDKSHAPTRICSIDCSLYWLFHSGPQQLGKLENYNNYSSTIYGRHIWVSLLSSMPHKLLFSKSISFSTRPPFFNMPQIPIGPKPFLQLKVMFANCNPTHQHSRIMYLSHTQCENRRIKMTSTQWLNQQAVSDKP
jgi:hypothetical protein